MTHPGKKVKNKALTQLIPLNLLEYFWVMELINSFNMSTQVTAYALVFGFLALTLLLFAVFNARGYFRHRQFLFALLFSHAAFIVAVAYLASSCSWLWEIALTVDFAFFPIKELFRKANFLLILTTFLIGGSLQWYIIGNILDYFWKLLHSERLTPVSVQSLGGSSKNRILLLLSVAVILFSVGKIGVYLFEQSRPIQKVPLSAQELKRATLLNKYQEIAGRLLSADPVVQEQAVEDVKRLDIADARVIVHDLIARIQWQSKENQQIRSVLAKIGGPTVQEAIQEQIDLLGGDSKWRPASLLGELGPLAKAATPALASLAFYRDSTVRDNANYALARIESIRDKASLGIEIDTSAYTVRFPMNEDGELGKQYWVDLGAGNIVAGVLKSKEKGAHPCSTEYHGVYTYGLLSIPENEHAEFKAHARQIALVSGLRPTLSPIEKYLFVEDNYVPPAKISQKISAIVDSYAKAVEAGKVIDKKFAFGRYGVGKNVEMLRVNTEYSLGQEKAILASFDFSVVSGDVKLARVVEEPSLVDRNGNPGERVKFSINDYGFYANVFDFDSDGIPDLAEDVSGYESCSTVIYKVINLSTTPVFIPILDFSGGL